MGLLPPPRRKQTGGVAAAVPSGASSAAAAEPGSAPVPAPVPPAELDRATRDLLSKAIARAVAESLGHVRISSVPPAAGELGEGEGEHKPESKIRSSIRVAAAATTKGGKATVFISGLLSLTGSAIVWFFKPEYAAPLAQALKLIGDVVQMAGGGGAPIGE